MSTLLDPIDYPLAPSVVMISKPGLLSATCMCMCRTITDHVKFVPYGMSYNDDPARIRYMSDMKGYCKAVLLPCFDLYEETKGSLPKHLAEVS